MVHRFFLFCFFLSLRKLMTIKSIKQRLYRYSRLNANKISLVPVKLTKFPSLSLEHARKKKSNLVANI